ncbi:MAG: NAD-dependent epimerase/dehydratase family protein [Gemmatimonadales bacterium]|nr:NAD-dependent epimerase/dehydratase family protein [Gemmatimonadales bacterium]
MSQARRGRVVVTGVAGFVGSNLADRLLAEGYEVVGIDNLAYGVREQVPEGTEFHQVDIRDRGLEDLLAGADALFHLAAKNCIADCQQDPLETAAINVTGSVNVFEACRKARVGKVVYAESSAVYEGSTMLPTPESEERPESFYALSKSAERLFALGYERWAGLRMTALRYFCVYGPRQDYRRTIPPVMSAFIIKLLRGERPTIYGSGTKRRDFVYVDDVNDFHLQCLTDARTDGGVYNLGSGTSHSVREIFDRITALLGSDIEPLYRPDLPGEALETLGDITAARALGWAPRVDLDEGLRRSIAHIREHVLAPAAP